jgi:hypothetical protein
MREGRPSLYRLIPGCCGASREQSREHRGSGPVWSPTPRRSGPTRLGTGAAGRARQGPINGLSDYGPLCQRWLQSV